MIRCSSGGQEFVFPHKVQGYSTVTLSLKPVGAPGDANADQMGCDRRSCGTAIRSANCVGHEQNLALPHIAKRDLPALWKALRQASASPRRTSIWCPTSFARPGLDYCSPVQRLLDPDRAGTDAALCQSRYRQLDWAAAHQHPGCTNACGHHHVGYIGILGVEKNGEEFYQITIGGRADEHATMGTLIARRYLAEKSPT